MNFGVSGSSGIAEWASKYGPAATADGGFQIMPVLFFAHLRKSQMPDRLLLDGGSAIRPPERW
ncbi:MAG: hypothetical protein V2J20_09820, partial [Wenzhouxiangella sp.]|nr:hypothetical protein [Wenzhouxiangella sp.]